MNILFISPSFPSRLARIRTFNLIKYLSRFHNIYLLSLNKNRDFDPQEISNFCKKIEVILLPSWKSISQALFYSWKLLPMETSYCYSQELARKAQEMIGQYKIDLVYVKRLRIAQVAEEFSNIPVIIDTTDAMSMFYKRTSRTIEWYLKPLFFEEYIKYLIYEKRMLKKFNYLAICSQVDKEYLVRKHQIPDSRASKIFVIPNGVDTEYFFPQHFSPEKNSILFSGIMYKHVNTSAALYFHEKILPLIKKQIPQVKFYIVGPSPVSSIKKLHGRDNIEVAGFAKDLRDYISKSSVIVCPILVGSGTRNKILQAWAMGRPVVSSSLGAEGLECQHGDDILIADEPQKFADYVVDLLSNQDLRNKLIANGLERVKKYYDMGIIIENLNNVLQDLNK